MMKTLVSSMDSKVDLEKCVQRFADELSHIQYGRADAKLVGAIRVDYMGTQARVSHLAQVLEGSGQVAIKVYDKSNIRTIVDGINKANIGARCVISHQEIFVTFPPLSQESRQKLVDTVRNLSEKAKIALRNTRRHLIKLAGEDDPDEDEVRMICQEITDLTKIYEREINQLTDNKIENIMSV